MCFWLRIIFLNRSTCRDRFRRRVPASAVRPGDRVRVGVRRGAGDGDAGGGGRAAAGEAEPVLGAGPPVRSVLSSGTPKNYKCRQEPKKCCKIFEINLSSNRILKTAMAFPTLFWPLDTTSYDSTSHEKGSAFSLAEEAVHPRSPPGVRAEGREQRDAQGTRQEGRGHRATPPKAGAVAGGAAAGSEPKISTSDPKSEDSF